MAVTTATATVPDDPRRDPVGAIDRAAFDGARRRRRSRRELGPSIDDLACPAAILDGRGTIVSVNEAWTAFSDSCGASPSATGVGVNYLAVCDRSVGAWSNGAVDAATGIRAVLVGELDRFGLEYPCPGEDGDRWCSLRVTPIEGPGAGAVVAHLDISDLKRVERRSSHVPAPAGDDAVVLRLDPSGTITASSVAAERLLIGGSSTEGTGLIGRALSSLLDGPERVRMDHAIEAARRTPGLPVRLLVKVRTIDGRWRELDLSVTDLLADLLAPALVIEGRDATDARRTLITQRLESRILDRLPMPTAICDERGVLVYLNEQAETILGVDRRAVIGRSVWDVGLAPDDPQLEAELADTLLAVSRWEGSYDLARPDGTSLPVHTVMEVLRDDEIDFVGIVAAWIDLTDRRMLEDDLAHQALRDPLTGLANRRGFVQHLEHALHRAEDGGPAIAVAFLDLDDFNAVNDRLGHVAGDAVLRRAGELIESVASERCLVARFGGDEFMVCCVGADRTQLGAIADQILAALAGPIDVAGHRLSLAASVGVVAVQPGSRPDEVLQEADAAMHAAKEAGKHRAVVFDDDLRVRVRREQRLAGEIEGALASGALHTQFQPQYDLRTGELTGFEALARWNHPIDGAISPGEFIRIAERSGQIERIGAMTLEESCAAVRRWIDVAPERRIQVAVNLSAIELTDPHLPARVARAIDAAAVPPGRVCLEVTESGLIDPDEAAGVLRRLKEIGVEIAIDDFGTGYSSLSRLHRFPLDHLKIDQSFVAGMAERGEDEMIVSLVLGIGEAMGVQVIAEGIETPAQLAKLAALGCPVGQGHLFAASLGLEAATALVATGAPESHIARALPAPRRVPAPSMSVDVDAALALLAHELAAPITVLSGWAEILAMSTDPDEIRLAAEEIGRAANAAQGSVELIRDAAASDTGNLGLDRVPIELTALIGEALASTARLLDRPVRAEVPEVVLHVDPRAVVAALVNLLRNASRHASPSAQVEIRAEIDAPTGMVRLHVIDDGPGVPADKVGTIFRRFGRANPTVRGTGLGLYVGRAIARGHGGDLRYQQAPGGGADFVLDLPLAHPQATG